MSFMAKPLSISTKIVLSTGLAMTSMLTLQTALAQSAGSNTYTHMGYFQVDNHDAHDLSILSDDFNKLKLSVATKHTESKQTFANLISTNPLHTDNESADLGDILQARFAKDSKMSLIQVNDDTLPVIQYDNTKPLNTTTIKDGYLIVPGHTQNFVLFVNTNTKLLSVKQNGKAIPSAFALDNTPRFSISYLSNKLSDQQTQTAIQSMQPGAFTLQPALKQALTANDAPQVVLDALVGQDPDDSGRFQHTLVDFHVSQPGTYAAALCTNNLSGQPCAQEASQILHCLNQSDDKTYCDATQIAHDAQDAGTKYHIQIFAADASGTIQNYAPLATSSYFYNEPDTVTNATVQRDEQNPGAANISWTPLQHHKIKLVLCRNDSSTTSSCQQVYSNDGNFADGSKGSASITLNYRDIPFTDDTSTSPNNHYYAVATSERLNNLTGKFVEGNTTNSDTSAIVPLTAKLSTPVTIANTKINTTDGGTSSLTVYLNTPQAPNVPLDKVTVSISADGEQTQSKDVSISDLASSNQVSFDNINIRKEYTVNVKTISQPFNVDDQTQTTAIGDATPTLVDFIPDAPTNLTTNSIADSSADISWKAAPGATSYKITYSKSGQQTQPIELNTTDTHIKLPNLVANTKYTVNVYAQTKFATFISTSTSAATEDLTTKTPVVFTVSNPGVVSDAGQSVTLPNASISGGDGNYTIKVVSDSLGGQYDNSTANYDATSHTITLHPNDPSHISNGKHSVAVTVSDPGFSIQQKIVNIDVEE